MDKPLNQEYDFAIIGAGPAGLIAARYLGREAKGRSVALLDRRDPWQEPVACAEAVHKKQFLEVVEKAPSQWVRENVDGVIFVSPDGTKVQCNQPASGYLIDRALMHKELAEDCVATGVDCNFRTRVSDVSPFKDGYRTLKYDGHKKGSIRAKVIIDGSGPGPGFCKDENIVQGDFDLEPAIFALVKGAEFPVNFIQLYFGKNFAPGGYAWLFPRDEEVANVGLVIGKEYVRQYPPRKALMEFLEKHFKGAEIGAIKGGGISCGHDPRPFASNKLFKVGDSANMVNPISRSGIVEAMYGGKLAAMAALQIVDEENLENCEAAYLDYKKQWEEKYGKNNLRIHKAKPGFDSISDSNLNRAAHNLAKVPVEKRTMSKIFFKTLLSNPIILWKMRGFFL